MPVLYVDILFAINLVVNYLLLFAAARLSGSVFRRMRALGGALFGAAYSLVVALPLPVWALVLSRLGVSGLMLVLTFGRQNFFEFLRRLFFFYAVSFLFAGVVMLFQLTLRPASLFYQNGVLYYETPAWGVVLAAGGAFLAVEAVRRLLHHGESAAPCRVCLRLGERTVELPGFIDTGNSLRDPFTGTPAAVCPLGALRGLLPPEWVRAARAPGESLPPGCRLLPCRTLAGDAVLFAFSPDEVRVSRPDGCYTAAELLVAVSVEGTGEALLLGPQVRLEHLPERKRDREPAK